MNHKLQLVSATLAGVLVTVAAAGIASASMDHGQNGDLGRSARADADGNGTITRAEWIAAANARFDKLDVNKDGKLTPDELPASWPAPWRVRLGRRRRAAPAMRADSRGRRQRHRGEPLRGTPRCCRRAEARLGASARRAPPRERAPPDRSCSRSSRHREA